MEGGRWLVEGGRWLVVGGEDERRRSNNHYPPTTIHEPSHVAYQHGMGSARVDGQQKPWESEVGTWKLGVGSWELT